MRTILELTAALRKRLHKQYLNPNSQRALSISELDSLASISQSTVPLFDDIVDAMDPPQDLGVLKASLEGLQKLYLAAFETMEVAIVNDTLELASLETGKGNSCPPSLSDIGKRLQDTISSLCSNL